MNPLSRRQSLLRHPDEAFEAKRLASITPPAGDDETVPGASGGGGGKRRQQIHTDKIVPPLPPAKPQGNVVLPCSTREGDWAEADEAVYREMEVAYQMYMDPQAFTGKIGFFSDRNLDFRLGAHQRGVTRLGRKQFQRAYRLVTAAGFWARGGEEIKATENFYLARAFDDETREAKLRRLTHASDLWVYAPGMPTILASSLPEERRRMLDETEILALSTELKRGAQVAIQELVKEANGHKRALTPIDIHIVEVALDSAIGGTFIPLEFETSEKTHPATLAAIDELKRTCGDREFHHDKDVNRVIQMAVEGYFKAGGDRTYTFAYQRTVHGVVPDTGLVDKGSEGNGVGAGAFVKYLRDSGRRLQLVREGRDLAVFSNVEVFPDLARTAGGHMRAHAKTGARVSTVLVPEGPGFSGGWAFMAENDEKEMQFQALEDSMFTPEFKKLIKVQRERGGNWFLSNNFAFEMGYTREFDPFNPLSGLGMEPRLGLLRAKLNVGNVSFDRHCATIGGQVPVKLKNPARPSQRAAHVTGDVDYDHIKSQRDVVERGALLIEEYIWPRWENKVRVLERLYRNVDVQQYL